MTDFSLSLKKYVNTFDAQTVSGAVSFVTGDVFNYVIRVKNEGPASTNGVTTVTDTLPSGIILNGAISAAGWTCTGTVAIVCTNSSIIAASASFPDITIPVKVTATSGIITNIASVTNPGCPPVGPSTDPGIITVAPPPAPKCSTIFSGALSAPITSATTGLCAIGTMTTFQTFTYSPLQNYTWSCVS